MLPTSSSFRLQERNVTPIEGTRQAPAHDKRRARLPLHQQFSTANDEYTLDVSEILSLHLSQHDPRREVGRPTDPSEIPRCIEFDPQAEINSRLDAIENGFRTLLKRREEREYERSSLYRERRREKQREEKEIEVMQRYPTLKRFTKDEATPLIDHSLAQNETENFIRQIPKYSPIKRQKETTLRPYRHPSRKERSPNILAKGAYAKAEEMEGRIRVSIKDDRLTSRVGSEKLQIGRKDKERARRKLSKLLAKTPRQESTTTFATDRPIVGNLFRGKSTMMGTNTVGEVSIEGGTFVVSDIPPEPSMQRPRDKDISKILLDIRRDREEVERERQDLQSLKETSDLSDSLKAFLREFNQEPDKK